MSFDIIICTFSSDWSMRVQNCVDQNHAIEDQVMKDTGKLLQILEESGLRSGSAIYAKGQERARRILEEAISLLGKEGSKGLTMRALARKADIPLSVLQHYFKTRSDVLLAIVSYFGHMYEYETDLIFSDANMPFKERLIEFAKRSFDFSDFTGLFHTIMSEAQTETKSLRPVISSMYDVIMERIDSELAKERPDLNRDDRMKRIAFMMAAIEGLDAFFSDSLDIAAKPDGLEEASLRYLAQIVLG